MAGKSRLAFLFLVAIFLITGAIGHDPWGKKEEPYLFGIIYEFYVSHSWLIPMDAGVPFMEKPPLYAWTAVLFSHVFDAVLPLYDAARLTSVFYMVVASCFLWKACQTFFYTRKERDTIAWVCLLLFLGTYGIAHWAHEMITDIPLLAGTCIALYGMSLIGNEPFAWKWGGIWLGIGMGMAFMSKGLFIPVVFVLSGIIILVALPAIRRRTTTHAIILATLISLPLIIIWPIMLHAASHDLFMEWFWNNNIGRFFGFTVDTLGAKNDRCHTIAILPLYAFPIFPLACIELVYSFRQWRRPEYFFPAIIFAIGSLILLISASARAPYFLPLYPMLALLGAPASMRFVPRFYRMWNSAMRIMFSMLAAVLWLIWWNLRHAPDHRPIPWLVRRFDHIYPADFIAPVQTMGIAFACLLIVLWYVSFCIKGNSVLGTAKIWFTGMAFLWCTYHALLLPWENETRSYHTAIMEMQTFANSTPYAGKCIAAYRLGENMSPMVEYYMGRTVPLPIINLDSHTCPLFLTFSIIEDPRDIDPHWRMVWHGTRLRDIKTYELRLYERIS